MNKYKITFKVDATVTQIVEAESKEAALEEATEPELDEIEIGHILENGKTTVEEYYD